MRDHDLMRDVLVRPRASTMRGCRSTSLIRSRAAIVFIDAISFHCGGVGGIAASALIVPDKGISRVLRGTYIIMIRVDRYAPLVFYGASVGDDLSVMLEGGHKERSVLRRPRHIRCTPVLSKMGRKAVASALSLKAKAMPQGEDLHPHASH